MAENKKQNDVNEEQVALVTGGSRGIGRAIAVELSEAGYTVIQRRQRGKGTV
jgi:NAD(P)-dependent dehydrogenase (short-subunit alcohol dehydrogenase family)